MNPWTRISLLMPLLGLGLLLQVSSGGQASPAPRATVTVYPTYVPPAASPTLSASQPSASPERDGSSQLSDLVKHVKSGVVRIFTYDATGSKLALGSGFFDAPGEIVTNCHVIAGADHAQIETLEGEHLDVLGVVGYDSNRDVARLRVATPQRAVSILPLAHALPQDGEHLVVIGSPLGLEYSTSDGIVSAVRKREPFGQVIQMTVPISHGNSGGPVVDDRGNVVGVVSFFATGGQNLNFAIPADAVSSLHVIPVQKIALWNRSRPTAGGDDAATLACRTWFAALEGQQYRTAWDMWTPTTQQAYVSLVANKYNLPAAAVEDALRGSPAPGAEKAAAYWDYLRDYMHAHTRYSGTFSLNSEDGDHAVVNLSDPLDPTPAVYLMFRINGVWKMGLSETYDLYHPKH